MALRIGRQNVAENINEKPWCSERATQESSTQCGCIKASNGRNNTQKKWRFEDLVDYIKELLIKWLMCEGLMAKAHVFPRFRAEMKLLSCNDQSDRFKWECQLHMNGKRNKVETSIRKGSCTK